MTLLDKVKKIEQKKKKPTIEKTKSTVEKRERKIISGKSERIYEKIEPRDTPREVLETVIWILSGKTKRSNKIDYYLTIAKLALEKAKKIDEKRYQEFIQTLKEA